VTKLLSRRLWRLDLIENGGHFGFTVRVLLDPLKSKTEIIVTWCYEQG
jgi:hypothetical protein